MNRRFSALPVVLSTFALACSLTALATTPSRAAEGTFAIATSIACAQRALPVRCQVLEFSREQLAHNIAYYQALVKVGTGDHDVIGVNRLVRESRQGAPVQTVGSYFFVHGSNARFHMLMISVHGGFGIYLAERNVDVWGIDLRNVQIPATVTDFSFASGWNMSTAVNDTMLATRIARWVRALSGQGLGQIILSGHSAGAAVAFDVVNAEAILPKSERDVSGLIPVEMIYKLPPEATVQSGFSCAVETSYRSFATAGMYFFNNLATIDAAQRAKAQPDAVSPYAPPLTNRQFILQLGGGRPFWPVYAYHPFAIARDSSGLPSASIYSDFSDIDTVYAEAPVFQIPNAMIADMFATSCSTSDNPYDDNLAQIRIPVLYIGAAGGFGQIANYTMGLFGSNDVSSIFIQAMPDTDAVNDFGHFEAFSASNSRRMVWEPVHAWIMSHSH